MASSQAAFAALQARTAHDPQGAFPFYRRSITNPDLERANAAGRELQPRPPLFPGYNAPAGPAGFRFSTLEPPPRKKRGRPNKEEFERRAAEARARGEEYPKRRTKAQKRSAEDTNKDSPEKSESVASPVESRARAGSLLSPHESGATSASQSANPFPMHSPQSNPAPESGTSVSESGSQGRPPQSSAPAMQAGHTQNASNAAPGRFENILHGSPVFPNQETGYGFSLPGNLSRDTHRQQPPSTGGPSIPHSQATTVHPPARDPYGYYPGGPGAPAPFAQYRHDEPPRPRN